MVVYNMCSWYSLCFCVVVSVSDAPVVPEKSKSKQEISRQEHLAAIKHEGDLYCDY